MAANAYRVNLIEFLPECLVPSRSGVMIEHARSWACVSLDRKTYVLFFVAGTTALSSLRHDYQRWILLNKWDMLCLRFGNILCWTVALWSRTTC